MGTLKSHQKTHLKHNHGNDDMEGQTYFCTLCKKTFQKLSWFQKHEQMHRETDRVEEGEGIYMSAITDGEYILPAASQYNMVIGIE